MRIVTMEADYAFWLPIEGSEYRVFTYQTGRLDGTTAITVTVHSELMPAMAVPARITVALEAKDLDR